MLSPGSNPGLATEKKLILKYFVENRMSRGSATCFSLETSSALDLAYFFTITKSLLSQMMDL